MQERDWRIFREDFNIAYKGFNPTLPIRNWDEAGLPKELRKVNSCCLCILFRCCALSRLCYDGKNVLSLSQSVCLYLF